MLYLKIENFGVAPIPAITTVGVSTTSRDGTDETIGEFGTGVKQAIAKLLRDGIYPTFFLGNLRVDIDQKPEQINDGLTTQTYHRVVARYSGKDESNKVVKRKEKLGYMAEMGITDWTRLDMALREFVANAIDRTLREGKPISDVKIETVNENQVRAKSGTTRVFIPITPEVDQFRLTIYKRFLQLSDFFENKTQILPKRDRNMEVTQGAVIYKKGVFVREVKEVASGMVMPSLYDYNLNDLELDECRNIDDYKVKRRVEELLVRAPAEVLVPILRASINGHRYWENSLNLEEYLWGSEKERVQEQWQKAWQQVAGDGVLVSYASGDIVKEMVHHKGYNPVILHDVQLAAAAESFGVRSDVDVLGSDAREGRQIEDANEEVKQCLDWVWDHLSRFGFLNGKHKPSVYCFREIMKEGRHRGGYYLKDKGIFINVENAHDSDRLKKIMLEELTHHITEAGDLSRDLQDYIFRINALAFKRIDELEKQLKELGHTIH